MCEWMDRWECTDSAPFIPALVLRTIAKTMAPGVITSDCTKEYSYWANGRLGTHPLLPQSEWTKQELRLTAPCSRHRGIVK